MQAKIDLTDSAVTHVAQVVADAGAVGIRVGVKVRSGCAGNRYIVDLVTDPAIADHQKLTFGPDKKVQVFVANDSIAMLANTVIDYEVLSLGQKQIIFKNPNAKSSCGCGESFEFSDEGDA